MNGRNVLIAAVALAVTMAVGDARADDCDPVDLPECVDRNIHSQSYWVRNNCDETVDLRVDFKQQITAHRFYLIPTQERFGEVPLILGVGDSRVRSVKCCTRYHSCNFDEEEEG